MQVEYHDTPNIKLINDKVNYWATDKIKIYQNTYNDNRFSNTPWESEWEYDVEKSSVRIMYYVTYCNKCYLYIYYIRNIRFKKSKVLVERDAMTVMTHPDMLRIMLLSKSDEWDHMINAIISGNLGVVRDVFAII